MAAPRILLDRFLESKMAAQLDLKLGDLIERHSGVIPSDGPSRTVTHGRCIAVGDSAGQALPLVGEGIRYCIAAGRRAGQAIAHALRDPDHYERRLADYGEWWLRSHYGAFVAAQKANARISAYSDDQWDEKADLLSLLDGDSMAAFLRGEFGASHAMRLLSRHPARAASFLADRLRRKIALR
jgi:digeranylgeranylglycerophospholipid reductase